MPTAKPRRDPTGSWKVRQFNEKTWQQLHERVRQQLKPFYLAQNAIAATDETFGDPCDEWTAKLLNIARTELSLVLRRGLTPTNAELRVELATVVRTLEKARDYLTDLSLELDMMLGPHIDVLEYRDKISDLIAKFEPIEGMITRLPRAKRPAEIEHEAAKRMAFYVLRMLRDDGINVSATANNSYGSASDAVKILKILGDALGVSLATATWKRVISEIRPL